MPSHPVNEVNRLRAMQRCAFTYFQHETNPQNGLVPDKTAPGWPASIAATGLALACYPVAVERGWISANLAMERSLATLRFFRDSEQSENADATGYRGLYYHFLDVDSGRRAWQCELSSVDSAFLLAGMLAVAEYFAADTPPQREIRELATRLYERADWCWLQGEKGTLRHGWRPESGFIPFCWEGFDEALLLYMLALGSPTHGLPVAAYPAWASSYEWKHCYGIDYLYCGPLFTHQLSHAWIDFRGIRDEFMRGKGIDYFENSRRATLIQQRYAIDNPLGYKGYGPYSWGITASDGPGPAVRRIHGIERHFYDYEGRGVPYGLDDGTLAPWAVATSLPFAPDVVLPTIHHFDHTLHLHNGLGYGYKATFNPTFDDSPGCAAAGWVSPWHFGLNQGPIVLMIENHLSGLPWQLMRGCRPVVTGLQRAGFEGGWLDSAQVARA